MLKTYDVITVTGTPGIGKSIFYAYFFQRYRKSRPDTTIITASFAGDSGIKDVVVFQEGMQPEQWREGDAYTFINTAHEATEASVTYLYDGPPHHAPKRPSKMVCFTSPNERWLDDMLKNGKACTLYMPLWTLDELFDAADKMKLGDDVTRKIEERFSIFGGVARGCLLADERSVADMTANLTKDIAGMDYFFELERLVKNVEGGPTRHRVVHYHPQANRRCYDVQIASTFVSRLILEKVTARDFEKRDTMIRLLKAIPKEAAFRGHHFEMKAHEQLVRGGTIETQCISQAGMPMKTFKLKKSDEFCFFDHKELSSATLEERGPYHIARAANFESVDSFYCPRTSTFLVKRKLLLFQMTMSSTNPVKGKRIVALLKAVGWLDRAVKDPASRVALICVCPDGSEKVIDGKQPIQWTPAADGESVMVIPGIDDEMARALREVDVRTLGDFRSKLPELKRGRKGLIKQCLEKFETYEKMEAMMEQIPQYVWKV